MINAGTVWTHISGDEVWFMRDIWPLANARKSDTRVNGQEPETPQDVLCFLTNNVFTLTPPPDITVSHRDVPSVEAETDNASQQG